MFARFFIDRPIFACVISVVIVILGVLSYISLPMALFPTISPPTIYVRASYPGASPETVAETVAVPLEEQINGVEDMLYMTTNCTNGQVAIAVTFKVGTNLDMAQVLVQNRVSIASPKLPAEVREQGVTTKKQSPTTIVVMNLYSLKKGTVNEGCQLVKGVDEKGEYYYEKDFENPEDNEPYYKMLYLSNYLRLNIRDEISRVPGVGDASINGEREYSMRIWLDPDAMMIRHVSAKDVVTAIQKQNIQVAAGQLGQQPVARPLDFQYILQAHGRLFDEEEFGRIIIRTTEDGEIIRLKDVARLQLHSKMLDVVDFLEGDLAIKDEEHRLPDGALVIEGRAHSGDEIGTATKVFRPGQFPETCGTDAPVFPAGQRAAERAFGRIQKIQDLRSESHIRPPRRDGREGRCSAGFFGRCRSWRIPQPRLRLRSGAPLPW